MPLACRVPTFHIGSHNPTTNPTTLQQLNPTKQRAIKHRLYMSLIAISCRDRDVAAPVRVHEEDVRAGHAGADAETDPLKGARGAEGEVYRAGRRGGDG